METLLEVAQYLIKNLGTVEKVYEYRDADGKLVFCNLRILKPDGKKTFRMMSYVGNDLKLKRDESLKPEGGWPLYGLAALSVDPEAQVFVVEGEKDANALLALGLTAVTSGSQSSAPNADWSPLSGREVVLWPDNDDAGRKYIEEVRNKLNGIASRIDQVDPAALGLQEKEDCSDWLAKNPGAGADEIRALIPKADITADLLSVCRKWIRRYCIVSRSQAIVLATWILHTWVIDAVDFTPYIHITAPEKGCGKTLLLESLGEIVYKPWQTASASGPVLYRKIHAEKPTLLLDESDAAFNGNEEYTEILRGILDAGFKRTGMVSRCEGKGADMAYKDFSCFSAKAFAGIGKLPGTVADRCIVIAMQRKKKSEKVERFRMRLVHREAKPVRLRLEVWAKDNVRVLKGATPDLPDEMTDRQQDISEPLIAIADLAGGMWPEDLRSALLELFGSESSDDGSYRVRLLRDISAIFQEKETDRIASEELCSALCDMEGQPWRDWNKGKGMDASALAKQLRAFHVYSGSIRIGEKTPKGYLKANFEDAWSRYCPHMGASTRNTATTRTNIDDLHDFEPQQEDDCGGSKSDENPRQSSVVAVLRPEAPIVNQEESGDEFEGMVRI